ncbi:eukaryotic translation initiation factor 4E-1A-like isoform X2 [Diorhabda carinulata]|uniref:eukaryotic translation initiation factor 4E-1A-like isoform X2 n=1 Tax=Diorhabda sublineata TaxID=1163346 RepID=UPI0024E1803C|nr:eukaryotic translation initiation factor 4E-1A-like isoform X2 [Diorhabda sublineata]XP_057670728.1 eukaryotic translation initiation factor 4E-1A-like isoform X2 [Diorhabda carinulata]
MSLNSLANESDKNEHKNDTDLEIPMDFSIKHPLQNAWTLWYYESDRTQSWEKNQKEIASFQTVEDFWSLYNHIKPSSELKQGTDYSLFKKGIMPMWEDKANKRGGRWLLSLERKQRVNELDRYWLDIILCLIGEAFEHSDEICGAVVNIRQKGDKIGVWTADAGNGTAVLEIGRKLKERLHIPPRVMLGYQLHKDTIEKTGSVSKYSYTV